MNSEERWSTLKAELDRRIENDKTSPYPAPMNSPALGITMGLIEVRELMQQIEAGEFEK